jgi:hypothetical protein
LLNLKRGFDENISLKPTSGDERFSLFKLELIEIFKLTFPGLKSYGNSLRLDKAIPEILKPHKMFLV